MLRNGKLEAGVSRSRPRGMHDECRNVGFIEMVQSDFLASHPSGQQVKYPSLFTQRRFGISGLVQVFKKRVNMLFAQPGPRAILECVVRRHVISPRQA